MRTLLHYDKIVSHFYTPEEMMDGLIAGAFQTEYRIFSIKTGFIAIEGVFECMKYAGAGFCFVFKAHLSIHWFAYLFPLPRLWFGFLSGSSMDRKSLEIGLTDKQRELDFEVLNHGEDIAENLRIYVFFHPDFAVLSRKNYRAVKQGIRHDHPDYTAVIFTHSLIHVNESFNFKCVIKTPKEPKVYSIPIQIFEKKIGYSSYKVKLEVV